jgi:hypothetical protein
MEDDELVKKLYEIAKELKARYLEDPEAIDHLYQYAAEKRDGIEAEIVGTMIYGSGEALLNYRYRTKTSGEPQHDPMDDPEARKTK